MTLQIRVCLCTAQSSEHQAAASCSLTLSSFLQTVYFGALRLSVFVVNAFHGRDMVLLFHNDIPLGPSCGQCYKKQIMLLVSVLSNLHKTINTSHREILQL